MSGTPVGSGFTIRHNIENFNDVNYNFQQIWRVLMGRLGTVNLLDGAITGEKIAYAAIESAHIQNATITSAQIQSLSANKITAGTIHAAIELTSAIITGGTIRTASNGNRLEMTSGGVIGYRSDNTVALAIEPNGFNLGTGFITFYNNLGKRGDGLGNAGLVGFYDTGYGSVVSIEATANVNRLQVVSGNNLNIEAVGIVDISANEIKLSPLNASSVIRLASIFPTVYIESNRKIEISAGGGVAINPGTNFYVGANGDVNLQAIGGNVSFYASGSLSINGSSGATGSFTSQDGKTVTVTKGIITGIV